MRAAFGKNRFWVSANAGLIRAEYAIPNRHRDAKVAIGEAVMLSVKPSALYEPCAVQAAMMHGVMYDTECEVSGGDSQGDSTSDREIAEQSRWQKDEYNDQDCAQKRGRGEQRLWLPVVLVVQSAKRVDAMEDEPMHCIFEQAPDRETSNDVQRCLEPGVRRGKKQNKSGKQQDGGQIEDGIDKIADA